jgi:hypothetical protein
MTRLFCRALVSLLKVALAVAIDLDFKFELNSSTHSHCIFSLSLSCRKVCGVSTLGSLKSKILKGKVFGSDPVAKAIYTTFKKATLDMPLEKLDRILDKEHFALVVHQQRLCKHDKRGWEAAAEDGAGSGARFTNV